MRNGIQGSLTIGSNAAQGSLGMSYEIQPLGFDPTSLVSGVLTEYVMKWDALPDGRPIRTSAPDRAA